MLGGHLDSWHAATGATDNAIGCAVVMEAARILKAIGVKPRRTIRVALWSGEEQGLRGSRAYVREQFGTFEEPKPAFARFGGYVNMDSGTGRPRFMSVFGPPAAADVLRDALAPFKDLGVLGANTIARRQGFSSDYGAFGEAGLPGIQVVQDPIEYNSDTWHTNLDTYERIVEEDAIKSAIVTAAPCIISPLVTSCCRGSRRTRCRGVLRAARDESRGRCSFSRSSIRPTTSHRGMGPIFGARSGVSQPRRPHGARPRTGTISGKSSSMRPIGSMPPRDDLLAARADRSR